jgi:hypothetical protein
VTELQAKVRKSPVSFCAPGKKLGPLSGSSFGGRGRGSGTEAERERELILFVSLGKLLSFSELQCPQM